MASWDICRLTTVRQSMNEMARAAARLIVERVEGRSGPIRATCASRPRSSCGRRSARRALDRVDARSSCRPSRPTRGTLVRATTSDGHGCPGGDRRRRPGGADASRCCSSAPGIDCVVLEARSRDVRRAARARRAARTEHRRPAPRPRRRRPARPRGPRPRRASTCASAAASSTSPMRGSRAASHDLRPAGGREGPDRRAAGARRRAALRGRRRRRTRPRRRAPAHHVPHDGDAHELDLRLHRRLRRLPRRLPRRRSRTASSPSTGSRYPFGWLGDPRRGGAERPTS